MFKLHFPSGRVIVLAKSQPQYEGMLYIWPEDLDPLLDIINEERNASQDNRNKLHRDKASQD